MPTIDDDIDAIFADPAFSVEATIELNDGSDLDIQGFFTDATEGVSVLTQEVEAYAPSFMCSTAEITDVRRGNLIEVNDTTYAIERKEKTGVGTTLLHLKTQ
jgi:hypothetical protein